MEENAHGEGTARASHIEVTRNFLVRYSHMNIQYTEDTLQSPILLYYLFGNLPENTWIYANGRLTWQTMTSQVSVSLLDFEPESNLCSAL